MARGEGGWGEERGGGEKENRYLKRNMQGGHMSMAVWEMHASTVAVQVQRASLQHTQGRTIHDKRNGSR